MRSSAPPGRASSVASRWTAEGLVPRILHQDRDVLILDKPAGLPVHAGPRTEGDLEALLPGLVLDGHEVPALAHRLDADTGGCLVLARHAKALKRLARAFAAHAVAKTYWAVVEGGPAADEGVIDLALVKRTRRDGWRMEIASKSAKEGVLPARTLYRVLGRGRGPLGEVTWLELVPETGRTHQLRVHCLAMGWPMVGDPFYGSGRTADRSLHLMSRRIDLPPLRETGSAAHAEAPPPTHMRELLRACGFGG